MKPLIQKFSTIIILLILMLIVANIVSGNRQKDNINQVDNKKDPLFPSTIVYFQTGSTNLDIQALILIEKMLSEIKDKSNISIIISGFSDPRGSEALNQLLSEKRAENVKNEFLGKGFAESQLLINAFGESKSVNSSISDYPKMRKVEIKSIVLFK